MVEHRTMKPDCQYKGQYKDETFKNQAKSSFFLL
jgi:hypothetical protein